MLVALSVLVSAVNTVNLVTGSAPPGPWFSANDCASERHTPAGCSARGETSNGLGACARCRCRACDAREVYARMLGMCSAHPEIPCLPMLPQVSEMKLSVLNRVNLRVEGSLACLLHELSAWGACGRCGAAGKAAWRVAPPTASIRLWRQEGRERPHRRAGRPPTRPAEAAL